MAINAIHVRNVFHKEDLEIKGWHLKEWVCPNCKHLNYTYDEED